MDGKNDGTTQAIDSRTLQDIVSCVLTSKRHRLCSVWDRKGNAMPLCKSKSKSKVSEGSGACDLLVARLVVTTRQRGQDESINSVAIHY